jgi:MYXO-CTERM domain-containing protein
VRLGTLQNGIPYTVGVAAVDNRGNPSPIQSGFVQAPVATGGTNGGDTGGTTGGATGETNVGLGNSGCGCRLAGVDRSAVPWGAMLALGVASRLRRRGKRQRQSSR